MAKFGRYPLFVLVLSIAIQLTWTNLIPTIIGVVMQKVKPINFVMSPQLLVESLYPIYMASRGATSYELSRFLGVEGKTKLEVMTDFERNKKRIARSLNGTLHKAAGLFGNNGISLSESFINILIGILNTDYHKVDFSKPQIAAQFINQWVYNNTNGHIKSIIDATPFNAKLMQITAMYFNGTLKMPAKQISSTFFSNLVEGVETKYAVNASVSSANYRTTYIPEINADVIVLVYSKAKIDLALLLPREKNDIERIENNLHKVTLAQLSPTNRQQIEITIPDFFVSTTHTYNNIFEYFGISQMLQPTANLKAMIASKGGKKKIKKNLFIHDFIQKIEFKQRGRHSRGSSSIGQQAARTIHRRFHANYPFMFLVKDDYTIYLAGRIGYMGSKIKC